MAALAAIRGIAEPAYDVSLDWVSGPTPTDPEAARAAEAQQFLEAAAKQDQAVRWSRNRDNRWTSR
jgi:hypothetical protein